MPEHYSSFGEAAGAAMAHNARMAAEHAVARAALVPPAPQELTMTDQPTAVAYFIQSRPHPGAAWERPQGVVASWESKPTALAKLADRRRMQPNWEHRLMERVTTVVVRPADEEAGR